LQARAKKVRAKLAPYSFLARKRIPKWHGLTSPCPASHRAFPLESALRAPLLFLFFLATSAPPRAIQGDLLLPTTPSPGTAPDLRRTGLTSPCTSANIYIKHISS
ncbi:MAG: hypothetical protein ACREJ2_16955, partial [Planctomycetota bacterium]